MYIAFGIVVVLVAILLACIVIIQNPKGGMLNSSIGGLGNQILGASRSTETVEKVTWYLAGTLILLCIASVKMVPDAKELNSPNAEKSQFEDAIKNNKGTVPSAPAMPAPAVQQNAAGQSAAEGAPVQSQAPETQAPAKQ